MTTTEIDRTPDHGDAEAFAAEAARYLHAINIPMKYAPYLLGISRSSIYRAAAREEIIMRNDGRTALVDGETGRAYAKSLHRFIPKGKH